MSFRSAWRHSARSPPKPATLPDNDETTSNTDNTNSEPTLVVTTLTPANKSDPSVSLQVNKSMEEAAKQKINQIEETQQSVTTTVVKDQDVNGKAPEETPRENHPPPDSTWFSWWGSPKTESTVPVKPSSNEESIAETTPTAPELESSVQHREPNSGVAQPEETPVSPPSQPVTIPSVRTSDTATGSYLGWLWSSRSPPKPEVPLETEKPQVEVQTVNATPQPHQTNEVIRPPEQSAQSATSAAAQNPLITTLPQTRSSWMSFWSRSDSMPDLTKPAGPETMRVPGDIDQQGRPVDVTTRDDSSINNTPVKTVPPVQPPKPPHTPATSVSAIPTSPVTPSTPSTPDTKAKVAKKDKQTKDKIAPPPPPNHVLPSFETVYPAPPSRESLLSRVTKAILPSSNSLAYRILPGAIHSHPRRCAPPPLRKAVAIGIHGFFPLRILRSVLGEPTGTSIKFASLASEAIHRYSNTHYGPSNEIEVVKIALEGEGTVAARIDLLWKSLSGKEEWMNHIREADLILVACHSQGSPVGAGIMARLVEEGIVGDRTRLGLLCIAGIHLGPAMEVGQRAVIKAYNAIESEAARELYDFQDSESKVARKYIEALRTILAHDTRITLVGSIDDHLVPMYSSTFSTAYHGAIYRAVFIDGRIHQNDFLARLVAFALRLRNEGWPDHGVMSELSSSLMGNFYTGEGHSRIYYEPAVYDLALRVTMETTSMKNMPLHVEPFKARITPNPYLLPWSMRGVFEETIRGPLSHELEALKEEFAKWDPKGAKLKDLKWRMEGWSTVRPKI